MLLVVTEVAYPSLALARVTDGSCSPSQAAEGLTSLMFWRFAPLALASQA